MNPSSGHHFISYSGVDGREHALWLAQGLADGDPPFDTWLDKERLVAGFNWTDQIVDALRRADSVLFVMTIDSVDRHSVCNAELSRALSYKKMVIPLRFQKVPEVPLLLEQRE